MRRLYALTMLPKLARECVMAATLALAVVACGGGGGAGASADGGTPVILPGPVIPTSPTVPDSGQQSASGTTFADVLVCADLDGDGQCSAGEQTGAATLSSPAGTYTLSWTGRSDAPLLAMLTVAGPGTAPASSSTPLACLDANGNHACDAGEAATNSHQAGLYQFTVPAGQSAAGFYFPLSPGYTPAAAPQITAGNRHLTVRWPAVAGALDYEVWYQQAGAGAITLSRAAIPAAGARVHTVTSLDNTRRFRVWVKARLAGGAFSVTAAPSAAPVSQTAATPSQVPGLVPTTINLPVLDISTQGAAPVTSLESYVTATFSLFSDGAARAAADVPLAAGSLDIRGRGNSTWTLFDKKPYRVRLGSAAALLGMPSNRHWVLLANHGDRSLLRNETIFELSRRVGMAWTPRSRFVEVFLNGNYLGNYELAEHIRTGSNRVNIASLGASDNAAPAVTGGYLLEVDWPSADTTFTTSRCNLPVRIDTPEAPTTQQRAWIQAYMESVETALNAPDFADPATGYASLLNVDTFVDWYLINELSMNRDSFRASTWFYKDRNAKLAIGPVWDYDLALGNNILISADPGAPTVMSALGGTCWYRRLLADPVFVQKVRNRWQFLRATQLASLPDFVDAQAALLAQSQANNFARWPILDKAAFPVVVVPNGADGEVEYLRWWLQRRIEWLDTRWGP